MTTQQQESKMQEFPKYQVVTQHSSLEDAPTDWQGSEVLFETNNFLAARKECIEWAAWDDTFVEVRKVNSRSQGVLYTHPKFSCDGESEAIRRYPKTVEAASAVRSTVRPPRRLDIPSKVAIMDHMTAQQQESKMQKILYEEYRRGHRGFYIEYSSSGSAAVRACGNCRVLERGFKSLQEARNWLTTCYPGVTLYSE
jgi:hypothetical protein